MHVGIVGGLDRNEGFYQDLARRAGHHFEHHTGHLAGRGAASLGTLVERCDVVIVVTDVNSHAAVWRVRRLAKQRGRRVILTSRCGPSKFTALLSELGAAATPEVPPRSAEVRGQAGPLFSDIQRHKSQTEETEHGFEY